MSKPFEVGAYVHQRLNLVANGKDHGRKAKASNRTWEIRPSGIIGGPREPYARVGLRTRPAIERAGTETPHLQRGAPVFYPNNTRQPNLGRTPSRESRPSGLGRVREAARKDRKLKF